jgi:tRNA threonylcarbamoyladenosine biosynthesis protein TsaE
VRSLLTGSEAETEEAGAALGARLRGGEAVLLSGELGSGKTVFVRGLARGLGADPEEVASPTFVLLTSYPGRLTLHHADLYRLESRKEADELGLDELPGAGGVLAVEWAERLAHAPWQRSVRVVLEHAGGERRRLSLEGEP